MASKQGHYIVWGKNRKDGFLLLSLAVSIMKNIFIQFEYSLCGYEQRDLNF